MRFELMDKGDEYSDFEYRNFAVEEEIEEPTLPEMLRMYELFLRGAGFGVEMEELRRIEHDEG